jgi:hypothetical protein
MAWTQADLDKLDADIASGGTLQSITFGDQTIAFISIEQKLRLRAVMAQAISGAAGISPNRLAATSKGV